MGHRAGWSLGTPRGEAVAPPLHIPLGAMEADRSVNAGARGARGVGIPCVTREGVQMIATIDPRRQQDPGEMAATGEPLAMAIATMMAMEMVVERTKISPLLFTYH